MEDRTIVERVIARPELGPFVLLVAEIVVFWSINPSFLSPQNIANTLAFTVELGLIALTTILRPNLIDLTTGITLCLLGLVIVAAVSLPFFALVRSAFLKAFELAPHETMREVVEDAQQRERVNPISRMN